MKYIYTAPDCPKCETLKSGYRTQGIPFKERSADRLKNPANDRDDIDIEAFVQLSMQNMALPVEVTKEGGFN
jgi:glutaredoxin